MGLDGMSRGGVGRSTGRSLETQARDKTNFGRQELGTGVAMEQTGAAGFNVFCIF
jgi:hypothetical protein